MCSLHYYTPIESQQCPSTGGPPTREWVLTDIADSTQLGTRERVGKIQGTHTVEDGRREESDKRVKEAKREQEDIKSGKDIAECQAREAVDRAREAQKEKETAEN